MNTLVTHLQPEKMHKKLQLLLKCVCKAHGYKQNHTEKKFITNLYSALQTAQNEGYNYELCLLHIIQFIPLPVLGMLHKSYSRVSLSIAYFDPQPCKVQPLCFYCHLLLPSIHLVKTIKLLVPVASISLPKDTEPLDSLQPASRCI